MAATDIEGYLGWVLTPDGQPAGTCFQIAPNVLLTAYHVLKDVQARLVGDELQVEAFAAGGDAGSAWITDVDELNDVAVLKSATAFPASVDGLFPSDSIVAGTKISVTGYAVYAYDEPLRYASALGHWMGPAQRMSGRTLSQMYSPGLARGMSGAPARMAGTHKIAGIVSARYNTTEQFLTNVVWLCRTEALLSFSGTEPAISLLSPDKSPRVEHPRVWQIPENTDFVGREGGVSKICTMLSNGAKVISIVGLGGTGKTSFARQAAYEMSRANASLCGIEISAALKTPSYDEILDNIVSAFGQEFAHVADSGSKLTLINALLLQHPTVFIVDSFENLEADTDLRQLIDTLAERSQVVLTTRNQIEGYSDHSSFVYNIHHLPVEDMYDEDESAFFLQLAEHIGTPHAIGRARTQSADFVAASGGSVLAMRWIIGQLNLKRHSDHVLSDLHSGHGPVQQTIFSKTWPRLSTAEKEILSLLSLFAIPPTEAMARRALIWSDSKFSRALRALEMQSLLNVSLTSTEARLLVHPLTYGFAADKLRGAPARKKRLRNGLVDAVIAFADANGGDDWDWQKFDRLESDLANIWVGFEHLRENRDERVIGLRDQLSLFLSIRGYWNRRMELAWAAATAAQEINDENKYGWCLVYDIAYIELKRGQFDVARRLISNGLQIFESTDDTLGIATCLRHLGRLAQTEGDFDAARSYYDKSLNLYVAKDDEYQAFLEWDIGDLARDEGNTDEAVGYFSAALDHSRNRRGKSEAIFAMASGALGALLQGEPARQEEASELLQQALYIAKQIGRADEIALSHARLAQLFLRAGNHDAARQHYLDARAVYSQMGDDLAVQRLDERRELYLLEG